MSTSFPEMVEAGDDDVPKVSFNVVGRVAHNPPTMVKRRGWVILVVKLPNALKQYHAQFTVFECNGVFCSPLHGDEYLHVGKIYFLRERGW